MTQPHSPGGSERAFGAVFALVLTGIGLHPLASGGAVRWWALAAAAVFALLAAAAPRALRPFSAAWLRFGTLLHRAVSPLVLGVLYALVMVPVALALRVAGKDPLRLRWDRGAASYWIERRPPGPPPGSFRNQF